VRIRVVLLTSAAALVVLYLLSTMGAPDATDRTEEQARVPRTLGGAAETAAAIPPSLRNVFEYSETVVRPPASSRPVITSTVPAATLPMPSPSPLVRLVGLVHRGGRTKAALAVAGDTVVLAPGESAAGYTVVSIDEDEGVRVSGPDGATIVLRGGRDQ
jgi:hypothetical protein